MGYEGIRNPRDRVRHVGTQSKLTTGGADLVTDHISVHSRGGEETPLQKVRPGPGATANIGDGKSTSPRFPISLPRFSTSRNYRDPLPCSVFKDNGENRRMGTPCVH